MNIIILLLILNSKKKKIKNFIFFFLPTIQQFITDFLMTSKQLHADSSIHW